MFHDNWKKTCYEKEKHLLHRKENLKKNALKSLKKKDKSIRKALLRLLFSLLSPSLPIPDVILSSCNPFYINFASVLESLMLYVIYTLQMYIIRRYNVLLYTFFYCTFAALLGDGDFSWTLFFQNGRLLVDILKGWLLVDPFGDISWTILVRLNKHCSVPG